MVAGNNSKILYESKIKQLKLRNIKLDGSVSVESIVETLRIANMSESTIKTYLCAIIWQIKKTDALSNKYEDFIQSLSNKISEINTYLQKQVNKGVLSKKQEANYLTWNKVIDVHNILKSLHNNSQKDFSNYLLVSLYVLFPPRRIMDYSQLHVLFDFDDSFIKENPTDDFDNKNYYVYDKNLLIFNNWKNKTVFNKDSNEVKYKQQHFTISSQLNDLLKSYIDKFNIKASIFGVSDKAIIKRLQTIFNTHAGKSTSADALRQSYITQQDKLGNIKNMQAKLELAEKMGHSVALQILYQKEEIQ